MDENEKTALNEISKKSLLRKSELVDKIDGDESAAESVVQNLDSKGLVKVISPFGERCFALTKKGVKTAQEV